MKRTTSGDKGKALLLRVRGRAGVALTPDGRFLKVRCLPHHQEGQEIELPAVRSALRPGFFRGFDWRLRPGLAAVAALAVCLIAFSPSAIGRVLASGSPVAYVTVDINPSLECGVNRWERVVAARALNPDGEQVLSGLKWRGRQVDAVVAEASARAVSLGFLTGGPAEVILAAVPASGTAPLSLGLKRRLAGMRETLSAKMAAKLGGQPLAGLTVETVLGDAASLRDQADKLGLSVGKYVVLLEAQEDGLDIDAEDLNDCGIGEALEAAGGHSGAILRKAHENREMSKLARKFEARNGVESGDDEGEGEPADSGSGGAGSGGAGSGRGQGGGHGPGGGSGGGKPRHDSDGSDDSQDSDGSGEEDRGGDDGHEDSGDEDSGGSH